MEILFKAQWSDLPSPCARLKALEKNPDYRYQTAEELADDLAQFKVAYAKPDLRLILLTQSGIITCEEALAANALHQTEGKDAVEHLLEFGLISDVIHKSGDVPIVVEI